MTQYQSEVMFRSTRGEDFLQLIFRGSTIQVISMLMIAVYGRHPQDTRLRAPSCPPFPLQLQNPDTGNSRGPGTTLTAQPAKWTMESTPCLHSRAPANSHHCLVWPLHHPARWGSPSLFAEKQVALQRVAGSPFTPTPTGPSMMSSLPALSIFPSVHPSPRPQVCLAPQNLGLWDSPPTGPQRLVLSFIVFTRFWKNLNS